MQNPVLFSLCSLAAIMYLWSLYIIFFDIYSRKRSPLVSSSRDETSVDSSSNRTERDADTVSLVLTLLASKDGVVLRRLLMAAVSFYILNAILPVVLPVFWLWSPSPLLYDGSMLMLALTCGLSRFV